MSYDLAGAFTLAPNTVINVYEGYKRVKESALRPLVYASAILPLIKFLPSLMQQHGEYLECTLLPDSCINPDGSDSFQKAGTCALVALYYFDSYIENRVIEARRKKQLDEM